MNGLTAWLTRHTYLVLAIVNALMSVLNVYQGDEAWAIVWAGLAGLQGYRAWVARRTQGGAA